MIDKKDIITKTYESDIVASTVEERGDYILQMMVDMLENYMLYWISGGTALGLIRDGKLIPYDTDIDIELFMNWTTYELEEQQILDRMKRHEFELIRTVHLGSRPMQLAFIHRLTGIIVDFYIYYHEHELNPSFFNITTAGIMKIPCKFVEKRIPLYFFERQMPFLSPPLDYLELRFGENWHKPRLKKGPWTEDANNLEPL